MFLELCASNYATFNGLVNGAYGIFKTSTSCEKTIIWIMFQNSKIGTLTREKYSHYYETTLNKNGHQLNLSSKI